MDVLAKLLKEVGAPILGEIVGGVTRSPTLAGLARRGVEVAADALGVEPEPAAVEAAIKADPEQAAVKLKAADVNFSADLSRALEIEAQRLADNDKAEREATPGWWAFSRTAIQWVVWGGWAVILPVCLFGGNLGVKPLLDLPSLVTAWSTVTMLWITAFHGGHVAKQVFGTVRLPFARG